MSTHKQNRRFTRMTNILILVLVTAIITSLLPDKLIYNYLGEIQDYKTNYESVDPDTRLPVDHFIHVVYTDKYGKTVDVVDDITLSERMITKSNFEYAYSVNPVIFPPYWWIVFGIFGMIWLFYGVTIEPEYLYPSQYINSLRHKSYAVKRLKNFFGI